MNRLRLLAVLVLAGLALTSLAAASPSSESGSMDRPGHFFFQIGAGAGFPSYGTAVSSTMDGFAAIPGVSRTKIGMGADLGIAVNQQSYFLLGFHGTGDRFDATLGWAQLNLIAYTLSGRWYPATTGFYLQGGAGMGVGNAQLSTGMNNYSTTGPAGLFALGYDFCGSARGFGLVTELAMLSFQIEKETQVGITATLSLCWK